ncbi:MAG: glycine--tRNA ligase [Candidatus Pacearchaeota archaeon]
MEKLELINGIALKRGFFMPSAEIYKGKAELGGLYCYGHLGKALKLKFENLWRAFFLKLHDNFHEIEGTCILPKAVFEASGHLEHFNDPLVECLKCHFRFRADNFLEDELNIKVEGLSIEDMDKLIKKNKLKCPKCKSSQLSDVHFYNMMFGLSLGAIGGNINAYLTPETAQQSYLAFAREFEALRKQLPLGLAVIGKVFRNEISPRQLFFRLREFTQAELQVFIAPEMLEQDLFNAWEKIKDKKLPIKLVKDKTASQHSLAELNKSYPKLYLYFLYKIYEFYTEKIKIPREKLRFRELSEEERAFYNKAHFDIELFIESLGGFKEVGGLHYRGDYDLSRHQKHSKERLEIFWANKKIIPHVIELSFGVDRNIFAFLDIFFRQEKERCLFSFPASIAPIDIAIFPLVNKDKLPEKAREVYNMLKGWFKCYYDEADSIGRRYRRQDEIGTPFCITIDFQSLEDNTVTVRDRDSMKQERIAIDKLIDYFCKKFTS